jgi:hypothetical protein
MTLGGSSRGRAALHSPHPRLQLSGDAAARAGFGIWPGREAKRLEYCGSLRGSGGRPQKPTQAGREITKAKLDDTELKSTLSTSRRHTGIDRATDFLAMLSSASCNRFLRLRHCLVTIKAQQAENFNASGRGRHRMCKKA